MSTVLQSHPDSILIEDIPVYGFPNPESLFARLLSEVQKPKQSTIHYLNVHVANMAHHNPDLKSILQNGDVVYCDGAGVVVASRLLGNPLPGRLTAADWFFDMLRVLAAVRYKVFILGGAPGVPEKTMRIISGQIPHHSVIGVHHGYFLNNSLLEQEVIDKINNLKPDILIVGLGTPLQEQWVYRNKHRLQVSTIYTIGAVIDYLSGKVPRCPAWMGKTGMEWLFRLSVEPTRLFKRYVVGNPWFISRILLAAARKKTRIITRKFYVNRRPLRSNFASKIRKLPSR